MPLNKAVESISTYSFKNFATNPGKALMHLGAVGLGLSCLAQLFMIVSSTDKEIDRKNKKFLIPQEIADGAINLGLYYTITSGIRKMGDSLLEKGAISTRKPFEFIVKDFKTTNNSFGDYIKGVTEEFVAVEALNEKYMCKPMSGFFKGTKKVLGKINYEKVAREGKYEGPLKDSFEKFNTPAARDKLLDTIKEVEKDFTKFKTGLGVLTTVIGSVIACSIITPIVRNAVANHFQKKALAKENTMKPVPVKVPCSYYGTPSPAFDIFNKPKL